MNRSQCSCCLMRLTTHKHQSSCTSQQPGVQQMGSLRCNSESDRFKAIQPFVVGSTFHWSSHPSESLANVSVQSTCPSASTSAGCNYMQLQSALLMHKPVLPNSCSECFLQLCSSRVKLVLILFFPQRQSSPIHVHKPLLLCKEEYDAVHVLIPGELPDVHSD